MCFKGGGGMKLNSDKGVFVIGDIHGMYDEFEEMLSYWNRSKEQLVLIGDLMDRGYDSRQVLEKVWFLEKEYQAIVIRGNHESMLLNFLRSPYNFFNHYVINGGVTTLSQLLTINEEEIRRSDSRRYARLIKQRYPKLESWLRSLPYYIEYGNFIIVHAGIDLSLNDWRDTSDHDFMWLRDRFHHAENTTGKQIIFGHTPTMVLNQNFNNSKVWRYDRKWGIDGGLVFGGQLHGLSLSPNAVRDIHSVKIMEGR